MYASANQNYFRLSCLLCINFACIKDNNGGCFCSGFDSENICTICLDNFHTEYGKCVATVPLFAETFNKEDSNVLCEKPIILAELLFELRNVVIQDSEDGKRTACKKCARKIVNCYRMFVELRVALADSRALDKGKRLRASSPLGHKHLRHLVVQFLFEASDLATEVSPRQATLVKMKLKDVIAASSIGSERASFFSFNI